MKIVKIGICGVLRRRLSFKYSSLPLPSPPLSFSLLFSPFLSFSLLFSPFLFFSFLFFSFLFFSFLFFSFLFFSFLFFSLLFSFFLFSPVLFSLFNNSPCSSHVNRFHSCTLSHNTSTLFNSLPHVLLLYSFHSIIKSLTSSNFYYWLTLLLSHEKDCSDQYSRHKPLTASSTTKNDAKIKLKD